MSKRNEGKQQQQQQQQKWANKFCAWYSPEPNCRRGWGWGGGGGGGGGTLLRTMVISHKLKPELKILK